MTPVSHALLPVFFGQRWIPQKDNRPQIPAALLVAVCGASPDVLSPHLYLDSRHTAYSHTVWAWLIFAVLTLASSQLKCVRQRFSVRVLILCVLAYGGHIFCDLITGGVSLFYPWNPAVQGKNYLPYWLWITCDSLLIIYFYLIYRWLPLRKRMRARQAG